jgi:hypothetical protein
MSVPLSGSGEEKKANLADGKDSRMGAQEIPAPLLEWFTAQFQFALREMFKRRSAIWAFDFRGHNPQTGEWEAYSLVLSIMPRRQLAEIQREMAEHMQKLAGGKN